MLLGLASNKQLARNETVETKFLGEEIGHSYIPFSGNSATYFISFCVLLSTPFKKGIYRQLSNQQ